MKNLYTFIALAFLALSTSVTVKAQSFENYLKYEGVTALADLAHPTNTFKSGNYTIYSDAVDIEIYYYDGYITKLRLYHKNGIINGIKVTYDNDWVPPFMALELLKETLVELYEEEQTTSDQTVNAFEKYLGKQIAQFNGLEITMVVISLGYLMY